jgi:hypothetical protein
MRGTVAKRLRKQAFKEANHLPSGWLSELRETIHTKTDPQGKVKKQFTTFWIGYRRIYRDLKKAWKGEH